MSENGKESLKTMFVRKMLIATTALVILLVIYILPNRDNEYSLELLTKQKLEYVEFTNDVNYIYLLDSNNYVAGTTIALVNKPATTEERIRLLLESIIIGGKKQNAVPNGFRAIIPAGTRILDIKIEDDLVKVNFSKELLDTREEYEEKILEALIYTITSVKGVNRVSISVEGVSLTQLPKTNIFLPLIMDKSIGINKEYNLIDTNNITSVTIYYLNKINNNIYYVPVTKYLNGKKDKIKIIIDELAGGPIYETNLMSFLSANAKLLAYSEEDNKILLNFNEYIFNDIEEKNILEEVSYSIAYSIFDNYNVKEVVFRVNNEIIKSIKKDI
ncbi:MAG: GerMN domain-containing protein [Bacilli bacterium]|nr:GerMN domain-containing protein [Bacilli bacterium]